MTRRIGSSISHFSDRVLARILVYDSRRLLFQAGCHGFEILFFGILACTADFIVRYGATGQVVSNINGTHWIKVWFYSETLLWVILIHFLLGSIKCDHLAAVT